MVGARGFEPPTSRSRTERSTRLSHAPTMIWILTRQKAVSRRQKAANFQFCSSEFYQLYPLPVTRHFPRVLQVPPDPPNHGEDDYDTEDKVEPMKESLESRILVPLFS